MMRQVADNEMQKYYEKYMPDKTFANAEVFGIDREGDSGKTYVYHNYSEYVALKGKAYEMSGGSLLTNSLCFSMKRLWTGLGNR